MECNLLKEEGGGGGGKFKSQPLRKGKEEKKGGKKEKRKGRKKRGKKGKKEKRESRPMQFKINAMPDPQIFFWNSVFRLSSEGNQQSHGSCASPGH